MNENEISRLMGEYKDEMGTCSRLPARRTNRVMLKRGSLAIATVAVFAATAILLLPGDATAAAIKKVGAAIDNAKSMKVLSYSDSGGGKMSEFERIYMQNDAWRTEWGEGRGRATVVMRDGTLFTNYVGQSEATTEPVRPEEMQTKPGDNALDFAKQITDFGMTSEGRTVSVRESGPRNGVPTYTIVMERATDNYRAEILVDKQTDLPITAKYQMGDGGRGMLRYRHDFIFNQPLDPELFAIKADKPIIDIPKGQIELGRQWSRDLGKVCESHVRDVTVASDGTVWIASGTDSDGHYDLPTELTADNGTAYARIDVDLTVSAIKGRAPAKIGGENIVVVGFAPLNPQAEAPKVVEAKFAHRSPRLAGHSERGTTITPLTPVMKLKPTREPGDLPPYFPTLDLNIISLQLPKMASDARANALEKLGDYAQAAKAYRASSAAWEAFTGHESREAIRAAKRCEQKAKQ